MSLFDFVKDVGEKVFGSEDEAASKVKEYLEASELPLSNLEVSFADGVISLSGQAETAEAKEKAILLAGNIEGVTDVNADALEAPGESDADIYVIKSGDTLSKIAKEYYGDPMKYPVIFEANREVIKDPDLIYPGQNIRIPKNA
ncbi:MAG: peptidoglycan-binding protein LysM [Bacteroidetes bacterium]|nr:MAG: peptidoglycan-binding protein LysM [Bacteroidota bacterium]